MTILDIRLEFLIFELLDSATDEVSNAISQSEITRFYNGPVDIFISCFS
jgi:hypothetical protein